LEAFTTVAAEDLRRIDPDRNGKTARKSRGDIRSENDVAAAVEIDCPAGNAGDANVGLPATELL
jgi:hypothetical protein